MRKIGEVKEATETVAPHKELADLPTTPAKRDLDAASIVKTREVCAAFLVNVPV